MRHLLPILLAACSTQSMTNNEPPVAPDAAPPPPSTDGSDDMPPPEGGPDVTCAGNSAPTTADASIALTGKAGTVTAQGTKKPVDGATIAICTSSDTNCPSATSGADGAFTTPAIATGGKPVDGFLVATKPGLRPTYVYPPGPLSTAPDTVPVLMLSPVMFMAATQQLGITPVAGDGALAVVVADCSNQPVEGATVTVEQNGVAVGTQVPLGGALFVLNVPPGDTQVGASIDGVTFRTHTVKVVADADTTTVVRPGF